MAVVCDLLHDLYKSFIRSIDVIQGVLLSNRIHPFWFNRSGGRESERERERKLCVALTIPTTSEREKERKYENERSVGINVK